MFNFLKKFDFAQGGSVDSIGGFGSISTFDLSERKVSRFLTENQWRKKEESNFFHGNNHSGLFVSRFVNSSKLENFIC